MTIMSYIDSSTMRVRVLATRGSTGSSYNVTKTPSSISVKKNGINWYPVLKLQYMQQSRKKERLCPLQAVAGCTFSSDDIVVKHPDDQRLYRYIQLVNGLSALLVHDPDIDEEFSTAEAAMCVGTVSVDNPHEAQGLPHFLEHMLFLGTEEFPIEDEFDSYLSKHGGCSNARTSYEYTCYYFEVEKDFLKGALKRFSQFFISPLFKAEAMQREVQFHRALQNDWRRLKQLQRHTSLPNHPNRCFSYGNKKSLVVDPMENGVDMREQILTFYHENYHAGSMKLVIIGGETLDVLETYVLEFFSNIKKIPLAKPEAIVNIPIWESGKLFRLQAVKDLHILELSWTLPSFRKDYMNKAEEYLAHLLEHEGRGSLLYFLKAGCLVRSISDGFHDYGLKGTSFACVFGMDIELTDSGLEKIFEIIGFVYQYIKLLHQTPPQEWIYKELESAENNFFELSQDNCAEELAENLFFYPPEHVLYGDYAYEWDAQTINHFLDYFRPGNMRIDVMSKSVDILGNIQHEPWFGSQYVEDNIPSFLVDLWKDTPEIEASLHLPDKNDFIIYADRSPCSILESSPRCRLYEPLVELKYKRHEEIEGPRADTNFQITLEGECNSLNYAMLTKLFVLHLKDELDEIMYQASISKLESPVSLYGEKLELKMFDFSDDLTILLFKIIEVLKTYVPKEDQFQVIKEDLERSLRNSNMNPLGYSSYLISQVLCKSFWDVEDQSSLLKHLNLADLSNFIPELQSQIYIKGNLRDKVALSDIFQSNPSEQTHQLKIEPHHEFVMCLPPGADLVRDVPVKNKLDTNSSIEIYFQIGRAGAEGTNLVKHRKSRYSFWDIIERPLFNQLRTKEQLGYVVHCASRDDYGIMGFCFSVQSSEYSPLYLQGRINNFINNLEEMLQGLDDESFNNVWGIGKEEMIEWYRTYFRKPSPQRRTLAIRIWGCNTDRKELTTESESSSQVIHDLQAFKKSSEFYPTSV